MRKIIIISVILLGLFYVEYSSRKHNYYTNGPENAVYEEPDQWLVANGKLPTVTFGTEEPDTSFSLVAGGVEVMRFTTLGTDTGVFIASEPSLVFESVTEGVYETAGGRIQWIEVEE